MMAVKRGNRRKIPIKIRGPTIRITHRAIIPLAVFERAQEI